MIEPQGGLGITRDMLAIARATSASLLFFLSFPSYRRAVEESKYRNIETPEGECLSDSFVLAALAITRSVCLTRFD